jgi:hypothetical protein
MTDIRHPEYQLEVQWQRHLPGGIYPPWTWFLAVRALATEVEGELNQDRYAQLAKGQDLVVTISIRPIEGGS